MDDQQTIRLECLQLAMKLAHQRPSLDVIESARLWADWVGGDQTATIHVHASASDPDALVEAIKRHTIVRDTTADAEVSITVQRPDGYLINKDFGGWYFTAPGGYGAPSTHWATEAEAIAHAQTHKAMASAWEPEDPQMGELAHPSAAADTDFDMKVAASIRRLNRMGVTL